ncbi:helix-turn-helix domain-containing protein [Mycobacteroides abscessus]|uniref:helix-turn-helix domain-containing protein n=1 Tax=Mycobacteroides abscessus TaxID=36809 RepID=UPI0002682496|nr:helix-turn-helix transcriptional regulator [Mycobacteroides abscessus]EIU51651.1 hypothetical protein MA6G0125S_5387 [Mycobacteroides abscessus 6G-0125-S]EIU64230.1 hypothetical protein MA6G0728S_5347 [Mycobacteroides abscessus 6G-0728-S]EIU74742.1 hypothetical protein MA6G1108_5390 [Mycobacteroides abscessus 6G-1108]EIV03095.1 helix-turn-helix domain protein [Mycobacteroides abscessus 6G-0728-R]
MESLGDLVDRLINERGETLTAFAERMGTNRQTVRGWRMSFPAPATLRRIAEALEVPYSTVLTAALYTADYIEGLEDILGDHLVHVVVRSEGGAFDRGDAAPVAVFTNADRAEEFVEISDAVTPEADFDEFPIVVDAAEPPPAVRVHTLTWSHRADKIAESSMLYGSVPTRVGDGGVSAVEGLELSDTGEIYQLRVDSLDPNAGREVLQAALRKLRGEGRLLPPEVDVTGGHSGLSAWAYEQSLLSPFDTSALQRISSPLQRMDSLRPQRMPVAVARGGGMAPPPVRFVPVEIDDLQAGDLGIFEDHAVLVAEPGRLIGADGQIVPVNEVVDHPGFKGFVRHAPSDASLLTDGDGSGRADQAAHTLAKAAERALGMPYVWGGGASPERSRANAFRPRRRVIVNMAETGEGDSGA